MIIKLIKKAIMASFLIYAFNMVAYHFNIVLPINLWTVGFTTLFDIPGIGVLFTLLTMGV